VVDEDLTWMSASELATAVAAKLVSPLEVVRAHLDRIDRLDPVLHAFITVTDERALEAARRAESAVLAGEDLGPLHGVPIALKDEAWTGGVAATAGSLLFKHFVPSRSGTVSERLDAEAWDLDLDPDVPDISAEQAWMWQVFTTETPLTATEAFQSL
jgi:Asp-tRNA(Asn)/Glu-tRNA(Gln) amidotransferase A subunit family amidase